jgi:protease-4
MSDPNRAQLNELYQDVYNHFLDRIVEARKINKDELNTVVNELQAFLPEDCITHKLVDELGYDDQMQQALKSKTGTKEKEKLKFVEVGGYARNLKKDAKQESDRVAVVYAQGNIVDGEGGEGEIGGDKFAKLIRKAREDEKVKALVLRVNSPGGSALASDIMWREVVLTRKSKPVVVSFGDVAASGGYFISCNSDRIFAQPNSITGSIGIFGLIPNAKKMLNEKLGITTDNVEVTKHGAFNMVTNPFDSEERGLIQRTIEKGYREFKGRVAEGRNRDTVYIESVAQGRVFTGNQALANGLVDELGTLDDAISYAAKKANLKKYSIKEFPQEKEFAEKISEAFGEAKLNWIKSELGEQYEIYKVMQTLKKSSGIQMRMPYSFGIE